MTARISRRDLIKTMGGAAAAAALGRGAFADTSQPRAQEEVDTLIVGSGFGGAVAARRLTEAGIATVMVERGRRWDVASTQDSFSPLLNPDGRSAWLSDFAILGPPVSLERYVGVLELVLGDGIAALAGAGFGGGSLVYAAAMYEPTEALFNLSLGGSVDYAEMTSVYYPRVRAEIASASVPWRILRRPEFAGAQTFWRMGRRAQLPSKLLELAVSWDVVDEELAGLNVPSVTGGEFWYGNNSGAKNSLDKNYLRRAEESGLLEVITQANVVAIREGSGGRFVVEVDIIDFDGTVLSSRELVASKLFLAAGSIGTSKLLVGAKARGGLPGLNEEVGRHWGNNGDFFSTIAPLSGRIKPNLGGTVPVSIEDHHNPVMPTTVECYADWSLEGSRGAVASVGMAPVPAKGSFDYDAESDDVRLTWPADDPEITAVIDAAELTYQKIGESWGARQRVRSGVVEGNAPVTAAVTAHPLGGVVLDRATDNVGTCLNYPGLYVIDGALIPGHTGCTNPALTIAALAERNIERIIARDFF